MRQTVKTIACAATALMLALTGCQNDRASLPTLRSASFTGAGLFTQYRTDRASGRLVPLIQILFVSHVHPGPDSMSTAVMSSGRTEDDLRFSYVYNEYDRRAGKKYEVASRPVHLRNLQTLEADGQSFALARGSVFVVHVERDGRLRAVQLPYFAERLDLEANDLLEHIKRQLPSDARLQAVPPQRG
ncbi:MAG TPA: hypothetical protein VF618_07570 [Thermoanaerobaculia bacterium]